MGWVQRQHHRRFNLTRVDTKTVFFCTELRVQILALLIEQRQVEPAHAVHQHIKTRA